MRTIFLDTETSGLCGLPFLIQTAEADGPVKLFHVLDSPPAMSLKLIENLCQPDVQLVAYNALFDVKMLAKLATVASMLAGSWSFDTVWDAERLWRPETRFEERLDELRIVYPGSVVDLMIAAQSLPPLHEEFLNPPAIRLPWFPVAAVPELERAVKHAITRRPFYRAVDGRFDIADRLRIRIANLKRKQDRMRVRRACQQRDYSVLAEVKLSFSRESMYSLKSIARILGYAREIQEFELLDGFGRIPPSYCPTYLDRELYGRLWRYVEEHQYDPSFLEYARRDVDMLRHVHRHYCAQPRFESLRHDFDVVPLAANLELYGMPVDPEKVRKAVQYYRDRVRESAEFLREAGLENYQSSVQVVRFVNRLLCQYARADDSCSVESVADAQKPTLSDLLARLKQNGRGANAYPVQCLAHLIRARTLSKRPEFFNHVLGDTIYPQIHVRGSVTDRMITSQPSVQNMPARATADEKADHMAFRSPFTPPGGYLLFVGDAEQFEMRLVAAEAAEKSLIDGFVNGEDPHCLTAVRTLGRQIRQSDKSLAALTDYDLMMLLKAEDPRVLDFRSLAKTLNFATLYGASEHGIARKSLTTVDEARAMLEEFFRAYPAIGSAVEASRAHVTLPDSGSDGRASLPDGPDVVCVVNRLGITRSFNLTLRLVQIFTRLGDYIYLRECLPDVTAVRKAFVEYYGNVKSPAAVVASQCRCAAKRLQEYCQRQAFNFRIQSLGAGFIKQLQARLAAELIGPGVYRARDLLVLPGVNVHDEIHLLVRADAERVHELTSRFMQEISAELKVPIRFKFSEVKSWADKA